VFVGCVRQYCYLRELKYCPHDDPNDFAYVIKVKENAPELLRRALSRLPVDTCTRGGRGAGVVTTGEKRWFADLEALFAFPEEVAACPREGKNEG